MSNSALSVVAKYDWFEELIDSDEAFLLELLRTPTYALLAYGFSPPNNAADRAAIRAAREKILEFARQELKLLKRP